MRQDRPAPSVSKGAAGGGLALLIPLFSALTSAVVPLDLRLLLVVLWLVTVIRPHWGLVVLAALVPLASWLVGALDAPPVRYAETLVLTTLSGALIAAARPRRTRLEGQRPALGPAAIALCAVVAASTAVMLQVMQVGTHTPWAFLRSFLADLTHDYLVEPQEAFVGIRSAALLVEGVALVFVVGRHTRDHVVRPAQLFTATAVGGAAAAVVTVYTFLATALQAASVTEFFKRIAFARMSVHTFDANAAGSFFAMTAFVALALAFNHRHARRPRWPMLGRASWMAVAALLAASMWITGSRMALVATIGAFAVAAATVGPLRPARWPRWTVAAIGVAAALVVAALAVGLDPRPSAGGRTASHMLTTRVAFMVTGLRMIASAPIFGVGIGRYFEMSGRFMPQSIYWFYFHENAHNNFLQIGGELGLLGLAAFVWMLAVAAIRLAHGVRADPDDRLLVGAAAGLGAFVATWSTSHPMLVAEVAYPFWILLGIALARADGDAQPPMSGPWSLVPGPWSSSASRAMTSAVVAIVIALGASAPLRARREAATLDLSKQTFGFYNWEEEEGQKFRWTSRRATFFIPLSARELRLPIRAVHLGSNTKPTEVSIAIGGRTFDRVLLADDFWVTIRRRLPLTPRDEGFQRIDIITDPTWSPAMLFGGRNADTRVLGVEVGEAVTAP